MAAVCASWSAGQHLASLGSLATKLDRLERQAELLDSWQEEKEQLELLKAHRPAQQQQALSEQVTCLKAYISSAADAELDGDDELLAITAAHASSYAVQLIKSAADPAVLPCKGSQVVTDLAAATLCMLSQRTPAHEPLASAGAIPALLQLLDPLQSACAVDNAAKALGNLSADAACRSLMRSSGGVGALVRLLKDDCPDTMQASAAASLALLAARDGVVQDSLRYLGGIPLLVHLLTSTQPLVAEAARCCLCALKHTNPRNAAEILSSLHSSDALARDYYKLKDALALLDESPSPALTGSLAAASCTGSTGGKAAKAAARELLLDRVCEEARREVAAAAVQVVDAVEQEVLHRKISRAQRPLKALHTDLDASIALLKVSLAEAKAAAAARKAAAAVAARTLYIPGSPVASSGTIAAYRPGSAPSRPSYSRASGLDVTPACRTAQGKHLMRYTCDEVVALLQEMGLDAHDTRPIKKAGLNGAELLLLEEPQLMELLGLPKHKARRLRRLQDAMRLYDAIATRVAQPRLTDIELRLWLAGQGCSSGEAGRVMKLLRSLVMNNAEAPYVSAWEWSVGWTWVMHALEVYGVEWRA